MGLEREAQAQSPRMIHQSQPWYGAYMAALFESDRKHMQERIRYAERLIISRERELLTSLSDTGERRALNNALHALRALGSCMKPGRQTEIKKRQ